MDEEKLREYLASAKNYFETYEYEKCIEVLQEILKDDPKNKYALALLNKAQKALDELFEIKSEGKEVVDDSFLKSIGDSETIDKLMTEKDLSEEKIEIDENALKEEMGEDLEIDSSFEVDSAKDIFSEEDLVKAIDEELGRRKKPFESEEITEQEEASSVKQPQAAEKKPLETVSSSTEMNFETIEKIRSLWTEGAELFRKKDYQGCINKMQELLKLDPDNEGALGYIDMAKEKIEFEKVAQTKEVKEPKIEEPRKPGSVDLYKELIAEGIEEAGFKLKEEAIGEEEISAEQMQKMDENYNWKADLDEFSTTEPAPAEIPPVPEMVKEYKEPQESLINALEKPVEELIEVEKSKELGWLEKLQQKRPEILTKEQAPSKESGLLKIIYYIGAIAAGITIIILGIYLMSFLKPQKQVAKPAPQKVVEEDITLAIEKEAQERLEKNLKIGFSLYNSGQFQEAYAVYKNILKVHPDNAEAQEYLKKIEEKLQEIAQNEALKEKFERIKALYVEGEKLFAEGNYTQCMDRMNKVLQIEASNAGAKSYISKCEQEIAKIEKEKARQKKIKDGLEYAENLYQSGKFEESIAEARKILELDENNPQALQLIEANNKGIEQRRINRINELIKKGESHFSRGEYKECADIMEEVLKLDPKNVSATNFLALSKHNIEIENHYQKAKQFFDQGKYKECLVELEEIFKVRPEDAKALELKKLAQIALEE